MKKLIFSLLFSLCTLFTINAHAQDKYYYVSANPSAAAGVTIQTTNIGITTSQTMSPGVVNTWTNTAPGGYYTNPLGIFSFGAWWITPTVITPITVQVLSGYTATLVNTYSTAQRVQLNISCGPTNFPGAIVTVPANGTITTPIPAGAYTYTTNPSSSNPNPTLIQLSLFQVF